MHAQSAARETEADLTVWESGEAELVTGVGDAVKQKHFDDIRGVRELAAVLSDTLKTVQLPPR